MKTIGFVLARFRFTKAQEWTKPLARELDYEKMAKDGAAFKATVSVLRNSVDGYNHGTS
jgi:hypothetical protein